MAYKFQLGAAKLSGSIEQTDGSSIKAQAEFQIGSTAVDETELSILEGAIVSTAELNYLAGADANINTFALPANTTISAYGQSLVDDADAAAARTTLGLGDIATQDSSSVDIDGGAMDGVVIGANSQAAAEFTTLSASSNLQIGGGAMIAGDLDVSGDLTGSGIALSDASGIAGEGLANNSGVLKFDVAGLGAMTSNVVVGANDLFLIYHKI